MKKVLFIILSLLFSIPVISQSVKISDYDKGFRYPKVKRIPLDTCKAKIIYLQSTITHWDSKNNPFGFQDRMVLQVGKNISRFRIESHMIMDSIIDISSEQNLEPMEVFNKTQHLSSSRNKEDLYINHPSEKITTYTNLIGSSYTYEEDIPDIQWTLSPDTLTILGYKCKKANCTLFGREYEAIYTTEIPLNIGPWKFRGLPGLILSVADTKKEIYFKCLSIEFPEYIIPITVEEKSKNIFKTTKKNFVKMEKEYLKNPASFLGQMSVTPIDPVPKEASMERKKIFIELED